MDHRLPERNVGENSLDFGLIKEVLDITTKA